MRTIKAASCGSKGGRPAGLVLRVHLRFTNSRCQRRSAARSDDEGRPPLTGQHARQSRQEHLVAAAQLGAADLPLENCEFMAKNEQLEFELPLSIPTGRRDS
jgi:hypothetical protein